MVPAPLKILKVLIEELLSASGINAPVTTYHEDDEDGEVRNYPFLFGTFANMRIA